MSEPLVGIARFSSPVEAHLAKAKLDLAGIPGFLNHEFAGSEVELMVAKSAVPEAIAILEGTRTTAADAGTAVEEARCLICRSSAVIVDEGPLLFRVLRALVLQIVPLPSEWFQTRNRRCGVCGYRWKEPRSATSPASGEGASRRRPAGPPENPRSGSSPPAPRSWR